MTTSLTSKRWLIAASLLIAAVSAHAADAAPAAAAAGETAEVSVFSNTLFNTLLMVSILLLLVIIGLAQMLQGAARFHLSQNKKSPPSSDNDEAKSSGGSTVAGIILLAGLLLPVLSHAQEATAEAKREIADFPDTIGGLDMGVFFFMLTVIAVEMIMAYALWNAGMRLLKTEEAKARKKAAKPAKAAPAFIETLNASVAIEQEETIMLDHEYDGIRELDNNLPPWWKYGFYLTILFSVVYLIHYHVSKTGPLQDEEYRLQLEDGARQLAEYRKTAASLVDETNVTTLTSADSLATGKSIFVEKCKACHKADGSGDVGPNLTDNYWLHGGDIKSVFTTIKYGVTSKGMQAWQNDLSPSEMQEVASYILSIAGTNVPGGKPAEGTIYNPKSTPVADSTASPGADSLKTDSTKKPTTATIK
ncbi:MAG: c-type cytochrome [Bacteroidia bacterium]|jgi:cytochrome c oxidase cbb3-type subunit 3|nr:c-type cytochrome [Bacteroidia bacterium]